MPAAPADELGRRGLVRADSKVELARSMIGLVVRAGAAKPDIGSVEAFRRTLLAARSIGYSDSGSGTYLSTKLFAKLGVADQVAGKSRKVRGPPSGEPVAAVVADAAYADLRNPISNRMREAGYPMAALVLMIGSFVVLAHWQGAPPGSTYEPAHIEDGQFVPGRVVR